MPRPLLMAGGAITRLPPPFPLGVGLRHRFPAGGKGGAQAGRKNGGAQWAPVAAAGRGFGADGGGGGAGTGAGGASAGEAERGGGGEEEEEEAAAAAAARGERGWEWAPSVGPVASIRFSFLQVAAEPARRRARELAALQRVHPNVLAKALRQRAVYQDEEVVVLNKPYGLPVHGEWPGVPHCIVQGRAGLLCWWTGASGTRFDKSKCPVTTTPCDATGVGQSGWKAARKKRICKW